MTERLALLEANCSLLARKDAPLAALIRAAEPDAAIGVQAARSGRLVPVVRRAGVDVFLHSRYDPAVEAGRRAADWDGAGCVVAVGLGGGFHVEAMLGNGSLASVVIVEKSPAVLRALFELVPLQAIIGDTRTSFASSARDLRARIPQAWQPALMGGLRMVPLQAWCALEPAFSEEAAASVRSAVDSVRADYSVQAHFGKRWFLNMIANLEKAEGSHGPKSLEAARVTAAGPSLDRQMAWLARAKAEGPLYATDTSLPALQRARIAPDAVLSIDCQAYSYHHFLQGMPDHAALFLDIASPPLLARRYPGARFVSGSHPFAAWLSVHWRKLPVIDTSGGNVTHAAVSLVAATGARSITLYGADYSYPAGKPYARGTYVYDVFALAQDRLHPVESSVHSFVLRTGDVLAERAGGNLRYTTPILSLYRENLLRFIRECPAVIQAAPGEGLPLDAVHVSGTATVPGVPLAPLSPAACGWREVLDRYASGLSALPGLADPPWRSLETLDAASRELWATVLPIAARVAREDPASAGTADCMERARAWAVSRARRLVESPQDGRV